MYIHESKNKTFNIRRRKYKSFDIVLRDYYLVYIEPWKSVPIQIVLATDLS